MNTHPSISVVVPTYNAPGLLERTLQSLATQNYEGDVQVVVVDDGSTVFEPNGWKQLCHPLPLEVVRLPTNQGRACARNAGIRKAQGELILFLDGDMTVAPGFLSAHAEAAKQHAGSVGIGNIQFSSDVQMDAMTRYMEKRGVARLDKTVRETHYKCFVTGNSCLPRKLLTKAGLFDEDFTAYGGEDLELGVRLDRCGASFHYVRNAVSLHGHVRPLRETCELMYTYGRLSLPVLINKHPHLTSLLRLDFKGQPTWSLQRLFFELALSAWVYGIVRRVTTLGLNYRLPGILFDYLWWYNRTRGLLDAERDNGNQ